MSTMWLLMATSWSEGTGKEEGEEALSFTSRKKECEELSLKSSHKELESLWGESYRQRQQRETCGQGLLQAF